LLSTITKLQGGKFKLLPFLFVVFSKEDNLKAYF